jgi:sulfate/thiosulfate transport system permease protein
VSPLPSSAEALPGVFGARATRSRSRPPLVGGIAVVWLSVIVLLPLAAVVAKAFSGGLDQFWHDATGRQALAALELTLGVSVIVTLVNVVMGTLIAWVLVRDEFGGKSVVNAIIDLPFALPTIVAGLTLLALYGPRSPLHVSLAYTRAGVALALLFVTLPFVVRAVQPVLLDLDRQVEEAAWSLGASPALTFRRVVLPSLRGAIVAGAGLGFARALGEFGSVVLISGNLPFKTEVSSVFVYGQIENDNVPAAAAVSVLLLVVSFALLLLLSLLARRESHGI